MGSSSSVALDVEDGGAPPPRGLVRKRTFAVLVAVALVGSVALGYQRWGSYLSNDPDRVLQARHLKFGGDSRFTVTDAGHEDKMRLQLHVHAGRRYHLTTLSRRTVKRTVLVMDQKMSTQPMEQKLKIGLSFYVEEKDDFDNDDWSDDDDDDDDESDDEKDDTKVRLFFNCTEFSIQNHETQEPQDPTEQIEAWTRPSVWQAMGDSTVGRQFVVIVASNGSVLSMETQSIHQAVVERLHQLGALPVEMTYKLELPPYPGADQAFMSTELFDSLGAQ